MNLPPPGIYGDDRVDKNPPPDFGEFDPVRGPHPESAPQHEIVKAALLRLLQK